MIDTGFLNLGLLEGGGVTDSPERLAIGIIEVVIVVVDGG